MGSSENRITITSRNLGLMKILQDLAKAEGLLPSLSFKSGRSLVKEFNPAQRKALSGWLLGCGTDLFSLKWQGCGRTITRNGASNCSPGDPLLWSASFNKW